MFIAHLMPALSLLAAQAGGGGAFGGGGGGGGGGGSFGGGGDGDGSLYLIYVLVRLVIAYPAIGIPLLILAVATFFVGASRGWWKHQDRVIGRARPVRRMQASRVSASSLRATDPAFDEDRFLARVRTAFDKAQASWCAQDLEPLRPFVSDGVFERFSLQVEEQQLDGWRQGMADVSVGTPTIVHVESGQHFDNVTVRIPFEADIHRVDRESGQRIRGSKLPRNSFSECWSFLRRRGTKTLEGEGLIEGKCPNCGADLTMNQSAKCQYCECLARSGRFDWVLVEITQTSEWRPEFEAQVPGLTAYAEHDPGLSVQQLEDRASVAFWRKCAADRLGDAGPWTRVADEPFCERYTRELATPGTGPRRYDTDCAVGSVRTLGILAGDKRDRAVVEVVWDGVLIEAGDSRPRPAKARRTLHRTLFVFGRRAGRQTSLDEAFTTTHCGTCGAHDTGGTDPACPYCGTPRTGNASTWLVEDILARGSEAALALQAELEALRQLVVTPDAPQPAPSISGLLAWSIALVRSDGEVVPRERPGIVSLAQREGLSLDRLDAMLEGADPTTPEPRDEREAQEWLAYLTELALADGSISADERRFLEHAGERLGLDRRARARSIRAARTKLYRESRTKLAM